MKIKIVLLFLTGSLVALAPWWCVQEPSPSHADEIPVKYRDMVGNGPEHSRTYERLA